ncbi:DUF3592 domain-containing protein [Thalassolituus sp. LLYu03]|uniref:DUF3592 domain-containing protein n=1 Tax=Thalassolituus sp. LLYu03 TaxID=3421656 RepID=UPI003D28488E
MQRDSYGRNTADAEPGGRTGRKDPKRKDPRRKGPGGFVSAFLGLFFLVGIGVFFFTSVMPAIRWLETLSWQQVPAQIDRLELESHRGDDSTTYSVSAHYHYRFKGREYHSEQVSIYSGSDNIGDYWQDLESRLSYERNRNQSTAWVDPASPQDAVLDRSYRVSQLLFGLIFMTMFCGISGFIFWAAMKGSQQQDGIHAALSGESPATGITSNNKSGYQAVMGFGLVFLLVGVSISALALSDELPKGNLAVLLVLIFPLAGIGMMVQGYRRLKVWKTIGATPFFPDPLPGCAGGQVGGSFTVSSGTFRDLPRGELRCLHVYTTRSGKESRTERDVIWSEKLRAIRQPDGRYAFQFDVPARLPGTGSEEGYRGHIEWELDVRGVLTLHAGPALAFERQWTLPVVKGSKESLWQPTAEQRAQHQTQQREDAQSSAAAQIAQAVGADGALQLSSRAGRHTGMALIMTLMGSVFAVIGLVIFNTAHNDMAARWLMFPVFFVLGSAFASLGIFWLGRSLETRVQPGRIDSLRRLFGYPLFSRQVLIHSPSQLSIRESLTTTTGDGQRTVYYRLVAESAGKRVTVAEGIEGRDAAEALQQKVAAVVTRALDAELGQG